MKKLDVSFNQIESKLTLFSAQLRSLTHLILSGVIDIDF